MPSPSTPKQESRKNQPIRVAVLGNPNCGKTTLFNKLTGLRHKVGNYGGVTVDKREGFLAGDPTVQLLDLPGIYSLSACTPDEVISRDVLLGRDQSTPPPQAVLLVIDATNLERNLFLASQVIELGLPTVVACNMADLLERSGQTLDTEGLSRQLGVPVFPTVGPRGRGIEALSSGLANLDRESQPCQVQRAWAASGPLESAIRSVAATLTTSGYTNIAAAEGTAILLLEASDSQCVDHLPPAVRDSVLQARTQLAGETETDLGALLARYRYAWLHEIAERVLASAEQPPLSLTDRLDRVLTHRIWGQAIFWLVMAVLFYGVFALAELPMSWIEQGQVALQSWIAQTMPAGLFNDLLRHGVIAGVGAVLSFFPQICILFLFIALLEDSGYMARAAFLMNRLMSKVGLHGKSFIPLLSAHACAIPAIMATRTIEDRRNRLATILVLPLMSCSARLPVYTLMIGACLPRSPAIKAGTLFSLYALGIVTAMLVARVLKKTLLRGPTAGFIIELPAYHLPHPGTVLLMMWDRAKHFLFKAGTVILALTIVLWALTNFPRNPERQASYEARRTQILASHGHPDAKAGNEGLQSQLDALADQEAAENIRHSYAGRFGRFIEPVLQPLGFNWEIGIGLLASFGAREAFVSTMGIVLSTGEGSQESSPLQAHLRAATWPDGVKLFTPLVGVGLMVFFALAFQCIGTLAVLRSETGGWRWPAFVVAYMTALAYLAALLIQQLGRFLVG